MRIVILFYVQTGGNRKWKIQNGGIYTLIAYISACKQDNNEIPNGYAYAVGVQLLNRDSGHVLRSNRKKTEMENSLAA